MPSRSSKSCARSALCGFLPLFVAACAAPPAANPAATSGGSDLRLEPLTDAVSRDRSGSVHANPLANNGLEVRQWIVTDESAVVGDAIVELGEEPAIDGPTHAGLQENGMRFYRVDLEGLEPLLNALGGTSISQQWWFGQVIDWKELHRRSLGGVRRAVAVDGRVRSFEDGFFRLLIRSWTLKTEEGPRLLFEMAPVFERNARNDIRRMLSDDQLDSEPFGAALLRARLEPGFAYVLTGEAPSIDWRPTEAQEGAPSALRSPGPDTGFGPDIAGPATLGEMFFRGEGPGAQRLIIVLIPRVPEVLYPPELLPRGGDFPDEENPAEIPAAESG